MHREPLALSKIFFLRAQKTQSGFIFRKNKRKRLYSCRSDIQPFNRSDWWNIDRQNLRHVRQRTPRTPTSSRSSSAMRKRRSRDEPPRNQRRRLTESRREQGFKSVHLIRVFFTSFGELPKDIFPRQRRAGRDSTNDDRTTIDPALKRSVALLLLY